MLLKSLSSTLQILIISGRMSTIIGYSGTSFSLLDTSLTEYNRFRIDETALRLYQIYMDHHPQFIGCIKESFFNYLDAL